MDIFTGSENLGSQRICWRRYPHIIFLLEIPRGLKFDQFDGFKRIGALSPVAQRYLELPGTQQDKVSPSGKPLEQEVGDPFML